MSERSPDLRRILSESLNKEHVGEQHREMIGYVYNSDEERQKMKDDFEKEHANIEEYENRHRDLFESCTDMTDEDFDREYQIALVELEDILDRVKGCNDRFYNERPYTMDFVDISKIKSLREFADSFPCQFVPTKEEIGRILALAKQMHEWRIARGEKETTDPLKVVDIGGANGVLGKLITDLAMENGLEIEYTIVDPDTSTVQQAAKFYQDNSSLNFREECGEDFNIKQYHDNPEILELITHRKAVIAEGKRKIADLARVIKNIYLQEKTLDGKLIKMFLEILKKDFGVDCPESFVDDREGFLKQFDDVNGLNFDDAYMKKWQKRVIALTEKLGEAINRQSARYDLVINSWMPGGIDFTADIRETNGAAILYAVERYGATGCRSDAQYPERPCRLDYDESFNPGIAYISRLGWISHSTPQMRGMIVDQISQFWDDHNLVSSMSPMPYSNAFIVQTKKGYGARGIRLNPVVSGIKCGDNYDWEKELILRGGGVSPTIELYDEQGKLNYFEPFRILADDNKERERGREERKQKGGKEEEFRRPVSEVEKTSVDIRQTMSEPVLFGNDRWDLVLENFVPGIYRLGRANVGKKMNVGILLPCSFEEAESFFDQMRVLELSWLDTQEIIRNKGRELRMSKLKRVSSEQSEVNNEQDSSKSEVVLPERKGVWGFVSKIVNKLIGK